MQSVLTFAPVSSSGNRFQPERAQETYVALIEAIAARDEAALAQLYDRYRVVLFGLLMRILNNREEAEDCSFSVPLPASSGINVLDAAGSTQFRCVRDHPRTGEWRYGSYRTCLPGFALDQLILQKLLHSHA